MVDNIVKTPIPHNVTGPAGAIPRPKITRQGIRRYIENFQERLDPRGRSYYWLAGELVEEVEQPEHIYLPPDLPTDVQANQENYITITPLQYNLTDVVTIQRLQKNTLLF